MYLRMFVTFVTRLHKAIKNSDGKHPVVLQITWDKNVRRKRTGLWVKPHQFYLDDEGKARLRDISRRKEKQKTIDLYRRNAVRIYEDAFENEEFNYKQFVKLLDEKCKKKKKKLIEKVKVGEYALKVSNRFLQSGQVRSSTDYKNLSNLIFRISPNDLYFEEFDYDWLKKVEDDFNDRGIKGFNWMNYLKILYGKAVQDRVIDFKKNPFKNPYTNPYGFDISRFKKRRVSRTNNSRIKDLTLDQLRKIKSYEPKNQKEAEYLDVWFFSFYMFGVNLTDVAKLEKRDIKDGRWYYERSKTGVGLKQGKPILPEALEIIERWSRINPSSKYVFPIITNEYDTDELTIATRVCHYAGYIRKSANRICKRIGIDGYFTYYSARYSSATLALNSGADRNAVSHLLDHSNFSTIDHYAGRADDSKIVEAMELLRI